jgi:methionyl-tRNA formyltransferase
MRILSPKFVARYPQRMINIHHSFLPAFIGAKPYHQAHERGVKIIGATAHIVTDDLDTGPIIAQGVIPVNHTHTAAAMVQAGRDVEKIVLAKAVKLVLEERVFLHGNRTIIFRIAIFHAQGRLVGFHLSFVLAVANADALGESHFPSIPRAKKSGMIRVGGSLRISKGS